MNLFGFGKKRKNNDNIEDDVVYNDIGDEIHIFSDEDKTAVIKKLNPFSWLSTGEQWCPECHEPLTHNDGYWECDICKYSITDDEAEEGEGYPTHKSTYEDDYEEYYPNDSLYD